MDKGNFNHHISRQFNEEIEGIRNKLLRMGGLVEQQTERAVNALINSDVELAEKVIQMDEDVDSLEIEIDAECLLVIARRQPAAVDLRLLISVIKVITDLERIGDQATRIAHMAIQLEDYESKHQYHELVHMSNLVKHILNGALNAFARLNVETAAEINAKDLQVDQEYISIFRQLTAQMMEDPRNVKRALNIMGVIRSLERIGDHASNICEYVIYMVKGEDVRHSTQEEMEKIVQEK